MSSLTTLESALTKDFRRHHVAAQAQRLLAGSASTFLLELAADGTHDWSTKALIAAAVGAVWTTARLQWPTLPWSLVARHLQVAKASEQAAVVASPDSATSNIATPANADANANAATNGPGT
ncbi:hypothetical protein [Catenulispora rubra]|uniref:hypothetical protein n=1 Tax=Catenulispora rubra TaxID=280293 RepID=UPI0018921D38|nr:hypothetical protein [Catenulispora rubra]